jgi:kinetochore protein Nuf2
MTAADIAEALHSYGIAPNANLRSEDIGKPAPDLLPSVLSLFLVNIAGYVLNTPNPPPSPCTPLWVWPEFDPRSGFRSDDLDQQLGFEALAALDNPEHHFEGIRVMRLYQRSRQFLESIQFQGFTLRDLLRPTPRRVVHVLSALINYLHFRQEKIALLQPVVDEFPDSDERRTELKARIAEVCADPCSVYALCSGKCLCQ